MGELHEKPAADAAPGPGTDGVLGLPVIVSGVSRIWGFDPASHASSRRSHPLRMLALIAASYLFDTALLALFAAAGTISPLVPLAYGAAGLAICAVFFVLVVTGLSGRARDPNLTTAQLAVATALQLACIAAAPELAFFFLNVLFIVFAFGALRLTVKESLVASAAVSLATGAILHGSWQRIGIPHENALEALLVWVCYASTLARCMYVGLYGSALRGKLHTRNLQIAASTAEIERLASHDDLTGALNRRMIWALLDEQRARFDATRAGFCVAILDLDHFKSVNDRFGHTVGDAALREFSATVTACLRSGDRLARHGGEEFMVLLPASGIEAAEAVLARIGGAVEAHDWHRVQPGLRLTVSGGIAAYRPGESVTELVGRADAALYEAKRCGRNRLLRAA